jgi:hypothetical protein
VIRSNPRRRAQLRCAILFLPLVISGCRSPGDSSASRSGGVAMIRTELYFGLDRAGPAPDVSEEEWQQFVAEEITPRFPNGLTVLSAAGQWKDATNGVVVREPSRVVIILRPDDRTRDASDRAVEEIRRNYVTRFKQDAVIRVDSVVRVAL